VRQVHFVAALSAAYLATIFGFSPEKDAFTAWVAFWLAVLLLDLLLIDAAWFAWAHRRSLLRPRWVAATAMLLAGGVVVLQAGVYSMLPGFQSTEARLLLLGAQWLACAAHVIFFWREIQLPRPHADPGPVPVWALAWLLVPLTNYLVRNPDFFSVQTGFVFLLVLLLIPLAFSIALRRLEVRLWCGEIAVPLGISFFYVFYYWPAATAALRMPVELSIVPHLLTLTVASVFLVALYAKARKWFVPVGVLVWTVSAAGAALENAGEGPLRSDTKPAEQEKRFLVSLEPKPDIYFLVYDAYARSELLAQFDLDNRDQEAFLKGEGFTLYDRIYSIAPGSLSSIAGVLNISPEAGIMAEQRELVGGQSRVHKFLTRNGYETHYALSPYMTMDAPLLGDHHYPGRDKKKTYGALTLLTGIAIGEFKFDLIYDLDFSYDEFVKAKREMLSRDTKRPKFLYAHSPQPNHSQNSGVCLPDETDRYASRLEVSNAEMRKDVSAILDRDRDSIIIIAGDHGPYLSGDCFLLEGYARDQITALHLSDRYGTFLAIRWPSSIEQKHDDIRILQDVFVSIVATLAEEPRLLRDRVRPETAGPFHQAIRNGIVTIGPDKGSRIY
jgi:hypothetical protein